MGDCKGRETVVALVGEGGVAADHLLYLRLVFRGWDEPEIEFSVGRGVPLVAPQRFGIDPWPG
jgi:hypothetical protein